MRLKIGKHKYKIWFEYKHSAVPTRLTMVAGTKPLETRHAFQHQVNCEIAVEVNDGATTGLAVDHIVASGFSLCKLPDKFVKEIGRAKALTSALRKGQFSRDERRQFWAAYQNRGKTAKAA